MRGHIENLKQKPEYVRHRVAFGVSVGVTGLIALIWLTANIATGTFALSSPQTAPPAEIVDSRGDFSNLVGAVGESLGTTQGEPELTIVEGNTTSTIDSEPDNQNQTNKQVIPF